MKKALTILTVSILFLSAPLLARDLFYQARQEARSERTVAAPVQVQQAEVNYSMQTFKLEYVNAKEVKETISMILGPGESVSYNEATNAVIVRASANNLTRVGKIISDIDKAPLQVHVEAKVLELKSGQGETANPSSMGFSWQYTSPSNANNIAQFYATATPTTGAMAQGLYAQLLSSNVSAFLQALETNIGYDFVAAPWITAVNHHESEILIGGRIGYRNLLATTTGTLQEVQYLSVGTKLKFTPHISKDGFIKMSIHPSLSDGVLVDGVPQESITETKNTVVVKDGQTIVIGGLTKDYKNEKTVGVPFLSDIPFFGTLFRKKELISEKRELMVLITPHIVTPEYLKTMSEKVSDLQGRQDKEKVTPIDLLK